MINGDIDLKMGATLVCNLVTNNWYNTDWYIDYTLPIIQTTATFQ